MSHICPTKSENYEMTMLPFYTVRRLYDDHTLEIIEDLIGGGPFNQASDPLAHQHLDPDAWRSTHKGSLILSTHVEAEKRWAFARAIAYNRYLPSVVLPRVKRMGEASSFWQDFKVVFFPDAIGILHGGGGGPFAEDPQRAVDTKMCLIARDINCTQDLIHRHNPFERTVQHWLDYLHTEPLDCQGLKLPRVEHLQRNTKSEPLEFAPLAY
jgi:hypothetical protein